MGAHGLIGYRSWRAAHTPGGVGGPMAQRMNDWVRITELVFTDFDAMRDAMAAPITYTPPPYGTPGFLYETVVLLDETPPDGQFLVPPDRSSVHAPLGEG